MGAGNILTNESPCHNFCVLSVAIVYFQVFGGSWLLVFRGISMGYDRGKS